MIKGFSRLSKREKIEYLTNNYLHHYPEILEKLDNIDIDIQKLIDGLSENVISTFTLPYSIAPNFLIDGTSYIVPMVTEESSVVAAASKSAGFWHSRGGFKTKIINLIKKGQVHFKYNGNSKLLTGKFHNWRSILLKSVADIDMNMKKRGGGIQDIKLIDKSHALENYFQIDVSFNTCNAMGANYMNSCLERIAETFNKLVNSDSDIVDNDFRIIMAILSNYSPDNAIEVKVECPVSNLSGDHSDMDPYLFSEKFCEALNIANADISRAVTQNKGLFNGIDAVALATGNDWRAVEANGHAYASRTGRYSSLSKAEVKNGNFIFEATIPMQVGTVGGITGIHPLVKLSLQILNNPGAQDLMKIMASVGLASNFAAVRSLITTGIQKGHMKMHLSNILTGLNTTNDENRKVEQHFKDKLISHSEVQQYINRIRSFKKS